MKQILWTLIAIVLALPAISAQAPASPDASDWNRVASLARGEEIVVRCNHEWPLHCSFADATQDRLFCVWNSLLFGEKQYQLGRSTVTTVRLDLSRRNRWIIIGIATSAGIVLGAAANPNDTATPRGVSAEVTGAIGALAGGFVATIATPLIPGRLIYRKPSGRTPHSTTQASLPPTRVP